MNAGYRDGKTPRMALLPGETPPVPEQVPYSTALNWKEYEDAGRERPYQTPREEFLSAPYRPSQNQLMQRWRGLPEYFDIPALYLDPKIEHQRHLQQMKGLEEFSLDEIFGDKAKEIILVSNLLSLISMRDALLEILNNGFRKMATKEGSATTRFYLVEREVEITPVERARISAEVRELIVKINAMSGMAGEIIQNNINTTSSLVIALKESLNDPDSRDKDGYSTRELQRIARGELPSPLPSNGLTEGIEQREAFDNGRVIDAVPAAAIGHHEL